MTRLRWWLLAALVAIVMSLQAVRPAAPPGEATNASLRLQARYAVGVARLREEAGVALSRGQRHDLYRGCERAALGVRDRLRLVPVAAELEDDAALRRVLGAVHDPDEGELDPELTRDLDVLNRIYAGDDVAEAERARLVERHGWFGRLAATWALPPDDAARRAPRAEAVRAASGLVALMLLAVAATVAGFVVLAVAAVRRFGGKLSFLYHAPAPAPRDGIWLDAVIAFFVLLLALGALGVGERVVLVLLACVVLLPRVAGVSWADWRAATGWHAGAGVGREFARGLLGYVAGIPVLLGGLFVTAWLSDLAGTRVSHPIVDEAGSAPWTWIFFTAVVWAPVVEETVFRGIFYRYLRGRMAPLAAALVTGFVFAAVHPQGWAAIPALMAIGAWLAVLREWRGSIIAPVTAHAVHNGILVTALYLTF